MALISNARQATSEGKDSKSGPVETGLTGPAATALMITTYKRSPSLAAQKYLVYVSKR